MEAERFLIAECRTYLLYDPSGLLLQLNLTIQTINDDVYVYRNQTWGVEVERVLLVECRSWLAWRERLVVMIERSKIQRT